MYDMFIMLVHINVHSPFFWAERILAITKTNLS